MSQKQKAGAPLAGSPKISSLLNIRSSFLRSVNVALDYSDRDSSRGYVVTGFIREVLARLSSAWHRNSRERAWRFTGDYGSGKSAFALCVARIAAGERTALPEELRRYVPPNLRLEPVLVSGGPEPIEKSIRRGLAAMRRRAFRRIPKALEDSKSGHAALLSLIDEHVNALRQERIADGILIILDELGQNLHHAAMHPSAGDISLLQELGEKADRSGEKPVMVMAILHQGLSTYSADLDVAARREWEKVAGRFKEVVFAYPIEQVVMLVAQMLAVSFDDLPKVAQEEAKTGMRQATASGLYGSAPAHASLAVMAHQFYPLHPTVLPVLVRLLRRFGQNERSLVGFLTSHEPHGFREFAETTAVGGGFFRLSQLYDYFRANLAASLTNGHASHWNVIEATVAAGGLLPAPGTEILKSIGLINLLNDAGIFASEQTLRAAIGHPSTDAMIAQLRDSVGLIHERGTVKGLSLWPHSSVNLDNARDRAEEALVGEPVGARAVASHLSPRAVVARRHYIETGCLRHFSVGYVDVAEFEARLAGGLATDAHADGQILVVLTNDENEVTRAKRTLANAHATLGALTLVGVSSPVLGVAEHVRETKRWEWIQNNLRELAGDTYARAHVKTEIRRGRERVAQELSHLVQLRDAPSRQQSIAWFDIDGPVAASPVKGILPHLSVRCDEVFNRCPKVVNELINRRVTSSAASKARSIVIEALATAVDREFLGFDEAKSPPEMAIYLSVLLEGRVHIRSGGAWRIRRCSELIADDPARLAPSLGRIHELLIAADIKRCSAPELFAKLRQPPFGVRDGMLPLFLAIYLTGHWDETAVYEDGTFLEKAGAEVFQRLAKEPEAFEFQHCTIRGVRLELFNRLTSILKIGRQEKPEVLAVVRPLMVFAGKLSDYAAHTERKLSLASRRTRDALSSARDPATLFFSELPAALGFEPFTAEESKARNADAAAFAEALNRAVLELRESYSRLLERISASILAAYGFQNDIVAFREQFTLRIRAVLHAISDPDLRIFGQRVGDASLPEREWTESVATYVMHKSPERWRDVDEDDFHTRVASLAARFVRTEAAGFNGKVVDPEKLGRAVRFTLTRPTGEEVDRVIHWLPRDEVALMKAKSELQDLMRKAGSVGLAAAAQFVWESLEKEKEKS